jgi:hypothetical protein
MKISTLSKITALTLSLGVVSSVQAAGAFDTAVFNIGIKLIAPVVLTWDSSYPLLFPEAIAGTAQSYTTAPADSDAAQFNATGEAGRLVTATVVSASVTLSDGAAGEITVDTFTFSGASAFDGSGNMAPRVGGTVHIDAADPAGDYSGTNTLRIAYQ